MIWLRYGLPIAGSLIIVLTLLVLVSALALGSSQNQSSNLSMLPGQVSDIPPDMLTNYVRAADATGVDWAILAAIGKIESDHNRSNQAGVHSGVNFAGCCAGSMQISIAGGRDSTWSRFATDGNGNGKLDIYDPADATITAAKYLQASGAPRNNDRAIFAYNHAQWYVDRVNSNAAGYRQLTTTPPSGSAPWQVLANPSILLTPSQRADIAQGRVDTRVVSLLGWIGSRHTITISALRSDHSTFTTGGNVSNHSAGRATDIAVVDGDVCRGTRTAPCGRLALELASIAGPLHVTELIYCFDPDPETADAFAASDHCDHIHAGYDA